MCGQIPNHKLLLAHDKISIEIFFLNYLLVASLDISIYFWCARSSLLYWLSLVEASGGSSLAVLCGFLIAVVSLVVAPGFC